MHHPLKHLSDFMFSFKENYDDCLLSLLFWARMALIHAVIDNDFLVKGRSCVGVWGLLFCAGASDKHWSRDLPEVRKDTRQKSGGKVSGQREQ